MWSSRAESYQEQAVNCACERVSILRFLTLRIGITPEKFMKSAGDLIFRLMINTKVIDLQFRWGSENFVLQVDCW